MAEVLHDGHDLFLQLVVEGGQVLCDVEYESGFDLLSVVNDVGFQLTFSLPISSKSNAFTRARRNSSLQARFSLSRSYQPPKPGVPL